MYDEVQDIQHDTLGIVNEALSASKFGWNKHFGTAKTEHNTLEVLSKTATVLNGVSSAPTAASGTFQTITTLVSGCVPAKKARCVLTVTSRLM